MKVRTDNSHICLSCEGKSMPLANWQSVLPWLDANTPRLVWMQVKAGRKSNSLPSGLSTDSSVVRQYIDELEELKIFFSDGVFHLAYVSRDFLRGVAWHESSANPSTWFESIPFDGQIACSREFVARETSVLFNGRSKRFAKETLGPTIGNETLEMKIREYWEGGQRMWWRFIHG